MIMLCGGDYGDEFDFNKLIIVNGGDVYFYFFGMCCI